MVSARNERTASRGRIERAHGRACEAVQGESKSGDGACGIGRGLDRLDRRPPVTLAVVSTGSTDDRRPTTDDRRPTADDRRPGATPASVRVAAGDGDVDRGLAGPRDVVTVVEHRQGLPPGT